MIKIIEKLQIVEFFVLFSQKLNKKILEWK